MKNKKNTEQTHKKGWEDFFTNPPTSGQIILVFNKEVGKYGIRSYFDGEFYDEDGRSTKGMLTEERWTHWMPLPKFEASSKKRGY